MCTSGMLLLWKYVFMLLYLYSVAYAMHTQFSISPISHRIKAITWYRVNSVYFDADSIYITQFAYCLWFVTKDHNDSANHWNANCNLPLYCTYYRYRI